MIKDKPYIIAISGVKNSGKTTLLSRLIPFFSGKGLRVAVIKHDGHDFEPDVPGTDSSRCRLAGAFGTAVFSENRCMLVRERKGTTPEEIAAFFPEADLIFLEGFKSSKYPKLELIRKGNSRESVCCRENLLAAATDLDGPPDHLPEGIPVLNLNDTQAIAAFIMRYMQETEQ
ncbi:MAG: molybdopterin-guanine dinucleotide biosynthesis protein B [Lachnospiraceae bacterium]|nr:molybdopterin-guanine dinucleotide biosynthesis protein B [Lachnospiraceae bacterium]